MQRAMPGLSLDAPRVRLTSPPFSARRQRDGLCERACAWAQACHANQVTSTAPTRPSDPAMLGGQNRGMDAVPRTQLLQDLLDIALDGQLAQIRAGSDLTVR